MREVSAHAQNDNRSVAAEIFAIGTYFPNTPRNFVLKIFVVGFRAHTVLFLNLFSESV
jgi:hypothetical protein